MELPTDQLDLPEPTSTALDPTLSTSLAVKRFVGSSPMASTIFSLMTARVLPHRVVRQHHRAN